MRRQRKPIHESSEGLRLTGACTIPANGTSTYYELEVIPGLAEFAQAELRERIGSIARLLPGAREERVRFRYTGNPVHLLQLRRTVAIHRVETFAIPRPRALLGHQNFETLTSLIKDVLACHGPGSFKTFCVSAAGSSSSVFTRIRAQIEARTGLAYAQAAGDLLLAVRPAQRLSSKDSRGETGWEVAARLSPRPLSARGWRVCDMPGALNGTVASTMMSLTCPSPEDRVLNLACGSGTLLIERLVLGPFQRAVGSDINADALACARQNLTASGHTREVILLHSDATRMPLRMGWATTVCADLPFGMLVGSHDSNVALYPRLLAEAARLTMVGGKFVVITHELRLFERVAAAQKHKWKITRVIPIKLPASSRAGYVFPRIYLLHRR